MQWKIKKKYIVAPRENELLHIANVIYITFNNDFSLLGNTREYLKSNRPYELDVEIPSFSNAVLSTTNNHQ